MQPEFFTLPDAVRDELAAKIRAFRHGQPRPSDFAPRRVDEKLQLSLLFEGALKTGGTKALEALAGLRDGTGAPALVLRNLPTDKDIQRDMLEGMRTFMGHSQESGGGFQRVADTMAESEGFTRLHNDGVDCVGLYGVSRGDPGRPTICFTAGELLIAMAKRKLREEGAGAPAEADLRQTAQELGALLSQPWWLPPITPRTALRIRLGEVFGEDGREPLLVPTQESGEGGGYLFLPFELNTYPRLSPDAPEEVRQAYELYQRTREQGIHEGAHTQSLEPGDLMLVDEFRVMHAGGEPCPSPGREMTVFGVHYPYVTEKIDRLTTPARSIT